jgi:hypothetical protein
MYNKESVLLQINEVESQIRRLRTIIEADLLIGQDNIKVGIYCCIKATKQLENIQEEITPEDQNKMSAKEKLRLLREQQKRNPEEYRKQVEGDFKNPIEGIIILDEPNHGSTEVKSKMIDETIKKRIK